ncbi:uncharacterized protein CANTADRAFT_7877 [Suhomyces tanzawaensis NRRL Y-17324]|uniref:Uncharacterized protein n=1 Tax=Suhomyces tanzawaensis NRRL Y-17324 TaxID=984487 RepID=A0A1E4SD25_9ASCO|nr:uncharacterized protein CANTADRAFT_7877 [Suhomyces tanzawaensis NRRL Y-17324]ODV77405.1 hypothetical protein CANTADRAFT_7877 [Suhomyces tanzawaensis NRRL Y-17324]
MDSNLDYSWDWDFGVVAAPLVLSPSLHSPLSVASPSPWLRNATRNHTVALDKSRVSKPKKKHSNDIFSYAFQGTKAWGSSSQSRPPLKPFVTIASIDTFAQFEKPSKKKGLESTPPEEKTRKVSTSSATSLLSDVSSASHASLFSHTSSETFCPMASAADLSFSLVDYEFEDGSFLEDARDDIDDFDPLKGFEDFIFYR